MKDALVDVLIPTYNRPAALAVTLSCLISQSFSRFRIIISDQSEPRKSDDSAEVMAVLRVLRSHGHEIQLSHHLPRRGMAEQRQYLLDQARNKYSLFLDDDLILEPDVLQNLVAAIEEEGCGFVGSAVIGLSYIHDERPEEQQIEFWETKVEPERVTPDTPAWERYRLHNAANLYHVQQLLELEAGKSRPSLYKVAWVGGCVLYDTAKLRSVGGFTFWNSLPKEHAGEDVYAQLRVMDVYGGCGIIPSGVYHQELPTTITDRKIDAPRVLSTNQEYLPTDVHYHPDR
jgi:glycosyltransferase involved in cell wall biosynthesis